MKYGKNPEADQKEAVVLEPYGGAAPNSQGERRLSCTLAGGAHMTSDSIHLLWSVGLSSASQSWAFIKLTVSFLEKGSADENQ